MIPTTIHRTCLPALVRRFPPERVKSNFVWRLFHHTCHAKDIQPWRGGSSVGDLGMDDRKQSRTGECQSEGNLAAPIAHL